MQRFRQYRVDQQTRDKYVEAKLSADELVLPYFIVEGNGVQQAISALPGVFHFSIDALTREVENTLKSGVNKILLFGVLEKAQKDARGTAAYGENNLVARAVKALKQACPKLTVITDVCLCAYTEHGHCGLLNGSEVLNDETLPLLAKMAVTHALAGADIVAPSAMLDGQVGVIRAALRQAGCRQTKILGYSAKYASRFYAPFREAAHSAPAVGDRRSYQMDYRNASQSLQEIAADIEEGADWVMVKPAHTYLDIIQRARTQFPAARLAAYHVSGEYMLIKSAAQAGLCDEIPAALEVLTAIKRAGADWIITYYAQAIAGYL